MSYNLLKGKKGIIFGALDEKSIAWKTALRCHEEGAQIVLTNAPVAMRMGEINKLAEAIGAPVIPCDVSSNDDVDNLIVKSMGHFGGGVDLVVVHKKILFEPPSQITLFDHDVIACKIVASKASIRKHFFYIRAAAK